MVKKHTFLLLLQLHDKFYKTCKYNIITLSSKAVK